MDGILGFAAGLFIIAYIIVDYNKNREKLKTLEKQVETLINEIKKLQEKQ